VPLQWTTEGALFFSSAARLLGIFAGIFRQIHLSGLPIPNCAIAPSIFSNSQEKTCSFSNEKRKNCWHVSCALPVQNRWINKREPIRIGVAVRRIILILLVALATLAWAYWSDWVNGGVYQPIAFPHKTHLDLNLPCTGCHQRAEKGAVAGRPPTALCLACHASGDTKSAEIKKLRSFGEKGQEIPWRRVWRLPPQVFFPHRAHVVVAKIKCQTCHGPMETLTKPPATPLKTLTMNDCIACHERREKTVAAKATTAQTQTITGRSLLTDCNSCHR
jgi:hypothetical protein